MKMTHFLILDIQHNASPEQILAAYYTQALFWSAANTIEWAPLDKQDACKRIYDEVFAAYNTLINPLTRHAYQLKVTSPYFSLLKETPEEKKFRKDWILLKLLHKIYSDKKRDQQEAKNSQQSVSLPQPGTLGIFANISSRAPAKFSPVGVKHIAKCIGRDAKGIQYFSRIKIAFENEKLQDKFKENFNNYYLKRKLMDPNFTLSFLLRHEPYLQSESKHNFIISMIPTSVYAPDNQDFRLSGLTKLKELEKIIDLSGLEQIYVDEHHQPINKEDLPESIRDLMPDEQPAKRFKRN